MHTGFMLCFAHHATRYVSGTVTWDLDVFWSIFVYTEMSWMFENYRQSQCLTMSHVLPVYEWCDKLSSVILCQHLFWKKAFRSWIGDRLNPPNRKPLIFICSFRNPGWVTGFWMPVKSKTIWLIIKYTCCHRTTPCRSLCTRTKTGACLLYVLLCLVFSD